MIIYGAYVVTMDAGFSMIENGAVVIKDGAIEAVGETREILDAWSAPRLIDGAKKLLMPGLINAHTHSPMTIFRGFADDMPLKEWLYDHIFPLEARFTNVQNVRLGTRLAVAEMLKSGTTTFNDMYYHIDEMAEVVEKSGMRAVLSESLIDFPAPNSSTPDHSLRFTEKMIQAYQGHPLITIGMAVHSIYSADPLVYRKARDMSDKYGLPFNTHLAETRWEFDLIMEKYGLTPTGFLENMGVMGENMIVAHAVHLTDADMELLAKRGVGVAHNPQCNMKLANGVAPIPQLLDLGVKVGIGTDGVASNNDLDLFDEMRTCALSHKLSHNNPAVMDARSVLEAATIGGARLLGMERKIGSIEPGKRADMIMIDLNQPHAHPMYNVYSLIIYSLKGSDVDTVIVDGQVLMAGKNLLGVDEDDLFSQVEQVARQIQGHNRVPKGPIA